VASENPATVYCGIQRKRAAAPSFSVGCAPAGPSRRKKTFGHATLIASGHDAAVDVEDGTGDPAGVVGEQVGDRRREVLRGADPAKWVEAVEALQRLVDLVQRNEGLVDGRGDDSRRDGVDADVTVGQLDSGAPGTRSRNGLLLHSRGGRGSSGRERLGACRVTNTTTGRR
jgi:hypothetical protein